jgi:hypothetical protein
LPGYMGMRNRRFWQFDPQQLLNNSATARAESKALLDIIEPAIEQLQAARADARVNAGAVDYLLFGARRMRLVASRSLDFLDAADSYARASHPGLEKAAARELLAEAVAKIRGIREAHAEMKNQYSQLWLRESKPYALDFVLSRFDGLIAVYDKFIARLQSASEAFNEGRGLPQPAEVGLGVVANQ